MVDHRMRWGVGALVALSTLASGCAHRSTAIGEGGMSALACDRARSEAEANALREAGARQAGAMDYIAARATYDVGRAKEWSIGGFRTPGSGFASRAAEECWMARKREREAELERKQNILTPPR
jgi:hypothetical protein